MLIVMHVLGRWVAQLAAAIAMSMVPPPFQVWDN